MSFESDIESQIRAIEMAAGATLQRTADLVKKDALANLDAKDVNHSPSFDDAITWTAIDTFHGEVVSEKDWSFWLEEGNAQSGETIYPRNAKVLHFFVNGEEVFTKSVQAHEAYHFMSDAGRTGQEAIGHILEEELLKHLR